MDDRSKSAQFVAKRKRQKNMKHNGYSKNKTKLRKKENSNSPNSRTRSRSTAVSSTPVVALSNGNGFTATLTWSRSENIISTQTEKKMLPTLMHWKNERGMMKDQPVFRLKQMEDLCVKYSIQFSQALSLRRQHIKLRNPSKSMTALGLGNSDDIKEAAELFEFCVEKYLRRFPIKFINENEQRKTFYKNRKKGDKMPPTPDFLFIEPVTLNLLHEGDSHQKKSSRCNVTHDKINWLDAKMFYGASLIEQKGTASGNVVYTATKYISCYGPGAIVFSYGFGEGLEKKLKSIGVTLLDANPLDLTQVENHQQNWCANSAGEILP